MAHTYQLIREQWLPKPIEEAFAFFSVRKIWRRLRRRCWASTSFMRRRNCMRGR